MKTGPAVAPGEFEAVVRKAQAAYEKSQSGAASEKEAKEVFKHEFSAGLSRLLKNKLSGENPADETPVTATTLSAIAALMEAHPDSLNALQGLQATDGTLSADDLETIQDLIAAVQPHGEGQEGQQAKNGLVAADNTANGRLNAAAAPVVMEPASPVPDTATMTVPRNDASQPANGAAAAPTGPQTALDAVAEALQSALAKEGSGPNPGEKQAEKPAVAAAERPVETPTRPAGEPALTGLSAEKLAAMIREKDAAAPQETPVRQMNVSPDQILAAEPGTGKPMLSGSDVKTALDVTEPAADSVHSTNGADKLAAASSPGTLHNSPATASNADIARQVQETITSSYQGGSKEVVIRLDPPELGRITIRFIEKPEGITGVLQVEQNQTRQEIERALPEIIQNLQNASIPIRRIDVVAGLQQQDAGNRDGAAFASPEQGFHDQPHSQGAARAGGFGDADGFFDTAGAAGEPEMDLTDKSINLLI